MAQLSAYIVLLHTEGADELTSPFLFTCPFKVTKGTMVKITALTLTALVSSAGECDLILLVHGRWIGD